MKIIAENKKAGFNYEIGEKFEAGIVLSGQEVKSLKTRSISLAGTYVLAKPDGVFWIGASIPPYQPNNVSSMYDPQRTRKLLLNKSEMKYLIGKSSEKGLTFVPVRLYTKGRDGSGKIKLEFGVARGKKKYDKRESIKKREVEREISRALSKI